jgi:hypothetical protein
VCDGLERFAVISNTSLQDLRIVWLFPKLSTCTAVPQALGRQLNSAWRALVLQPHPLATWPSSQEVILEVSCLRSVIKAMDQGKILA